MAKQLKIFISAYACEPGKGSEPGIGWNVVNELAKYNEVHVLTRANNRESIEAALAGRTENVPVFHYYDVPRALSFWKKKRRGYHLYYYLWQYGAYFKYRKFVNSYGFDIVQHLTFANFSVPSLFMFCKPLTVWGPIGVIPVPAGIKRALPLKIRIKESLRRLVMQLLCHLEPMRVLTPVAADFLMEYRENPQSSFPAKWQYKVIKHSQTGINHKEPEYNIQRKRQPDGKVRLLICCDLLHWKGVRFSAEIFARIAAERKDVELVIYGSGPEKTPMKKIFQNAGVADKVIFKGFVSKQEMLQALADADILLYPSYHHGLATVILQAMYFRLPIVALKGDHIAQVVSAGAGLVADGTNKETLLNDLECKTLQLIESADLRQQLGSRGRYLIENVYDWEILTGKLSDKLATLCRERGK